MSEPPRSSHREALLHVANCPSCMRGLANVFEQLRDELLREKSESQRRSEIFGRDYAPRVSSTRFTVTPGEML